jgi:hypothetical protein
MNEKTEFWLSCGDGPMFVPVVGTISKKVFLKEFGEAAVIRFATPLEKKGLIFSKTMNFGIATNRHKGYSLFPPTKLPLTIVLYEFVGLEPAEGTEIEGKQIRDGVLVEMFETKKQAMDLFNQKWA